MQSNYVTTKGSHMLVFHSTLSSSMENIARLSLLIEISVNDYGNLSCYYERMKVHLEQRKTNASPLFNIINMELDWTGY